eukprot:242234_1
MLGDIKYGQSKYIRKYNNKNRKNKKIYNRYFRYADKKVFCPIKDKFNGFEILSIRNSWNNNGYELLLMESRTRQINIYTVVDTEINKYLIKNSNKIIKYKKKPQYTKNKNGKFNHKYRNNKANSNRNSIDFRLCQEELLNPLRPTDSTIVIELLKPETAHYYSYIYGYLIPIQKTFWTLLWRINRELDCNKLVRIKLEDITHKIGCDLKQLTNIMEKMRRQNLIHYDRFPVLKWKCIPYPYYVNLKVTTTVCDVCESINGGTFYQIEPLRLRMQRYKITFQSCVDCIDNNCCRCKDVLVRCEDGLDRCKNCYLKWYPNIVTNIIQIWIRQSVNIFIGQDVIHMLCYYCSYIVHKKKNLRKYYYYI